MLTTGELSKKYGVSVRTIQFYDKKNILTPSFVNQKGYRFYDENAEFRLNCIILYKSLGFSLSEISELLDSNDFSNLIKILDFKVKLFKTEIDTIKKNIDKLNLAIEMINTHDTLSIENILELDEILKKQKNYKKTTIITKILMISYILFLSCVAPIFLNLGGVYIIIIILMTLLQLFGLIYYHSSTNAYICPKCNKKFTITFFRDMFSINGGKKGKKLKCPYCNFKGYFKETYKDN